MNENPYNPPPSLSGDAADASAPHGPPWRVRLAVLLAVVSFVFGVALQFVESGAHEMEITLFTLPPLAVMVAFFVWLYWKIRLGRNWARITLLVLSLGGLALSTQYSGEEWGSTPLERAHSVTANVISVAQLVLLFLTPGRKWFHRRRPSSDAAAVVSPPPMETAAAFSLEPAMEAADAPETPGPNTAPPAP